MRLRKGHGLTLLTLACLSPLGSLPTIAAPSVQAGFSPEGSAEQLVLKTIEAAQHNIRLMGYSFTSPEVLALLLVQNVGVWMSGGDWTGKPIPGKTIMPAG